MPTLSDYGITVNEAQLPFLRIKGKETALRIVEPMPVPNDPDAKIKTLARFKVELQPSGELRIWDVSSRRLLAQLGALKDVSWPFSVTRSGTGTNTVYEVKADPEPQPEDHEA